MHVSKLVGVLGNNASWPANSNHGNLKFNSWTFRLCRYESLTGINNYQINFINGVVHIKRHITLVQLNSLPVTIDLINSDVIRIFSCPAFCKRLNPEVKESVGLLNRRNIESQLRVGKWWVNRNKGHLICAGELLLFASFNRHDGIVVNGAISIVWPCKLINCVVIIWIYHLIIPLAHLVRQDGWWGDGRRCRYTVHLDLIHETWQDSWQSWFLSYNIEVYYLFLMIMHNLKVVLYVYWWIEGIGWRQLWVWGSWI